MGAQGLAGMLCKHLQEVYTYVTMQGTGRIVLLVIRAPMMTFITYDMVVDRKHCSRIGNSGKEFTPHFPW